MAVSWGKTLVLIPVLLSWHGTGHVLDERYRTIKSATRHDKWAGHEWVKVRTVGESDNGGLCGGRGTPVCYPGLHYFLSGTQPLTARLRRQRQKVQWRKGRRARHQHGPEMKGRKSAVRLIKQCCFFMFMLCSVKTRESCRPGGFISGLQVRFLCLFCTV